MAIGQGSIVGLVRTFLTFFFALFRTCPRDVLELFLDKQKHLADPSRGLSDDFFGRFRKVSTEPPR